MSGWLNALLGIGGAVAGAVTGGGKQTQTTTQNQQQSSSGTGVQQKILIGEQQEGIGQLTNNLSNIMQNPGAGLDSLRAGAKTKVNRSFSGAPQAIRGKYLRGGGNASGKVGRAGREVEMARRGAVNDVDTTYDGLAIDRQANAANAWQSFIAQNFGQFNSTNANSQSSGESKTVGTPPGGALGGALNGGLSSITALMTLDKLLRRGGGGGGTQPYNGGTV